MFLIWIKTELLERKEPAVASGLTNLELVNHTQCYGVIGRDVIVIFIVETIIFIQQVDFVINIGGEVLLK